MRFYLFLSLIVLSNTLIAELISIGLKSGVPITENFSAGESGFHAGFSVYGSKTRRYTFGPTVTMRLPHRLGLEVDGLYRRLNYDSFRYSITTVSDGGTTHSWSTTAGNRFEVPILLRWTTTSRVYIVAGPTLSIHSGFTQRTHRIANFVRAGYSDTFQTSSKPIELLHRVDAGAAVGVGYDAGSKWLHLKPELRYSLWISRGFLSTPYFSPARNELAFLLGFEFGDR